MLSSSSQSFRGAASGNLGEFPASGTLPECLMKCAPRSCGAVCLPISAWRPPRPSGATNKRRSNRPKASRSSRARSSSAPRAWSACRSRKRPSTWPVWRRCPTCSRRACWSPTTSQHQRPMMGAFLDALGIAHEEGLINEESPKAPDAETLDKRRQGARRPSFRRPMSRAISGRCSGRTRRPGAASRIVPNSRAE